MGDLHLQMFWFGYNHGIFILKTLPPIRFWCNWPQETLTEPLLLHTMIPITETFCCKTAYDYPIWMIAKIWNAFTIVEALCE